MYGRSKKVPEAPDDSFNNKSLRFEVKSINEIPDG